MRSNVECMYIETIGSITVHSLRSSGRGPQLQGVGVVKDILTISDDILVHTHDISPQEALSAKEWEWSRMKRKQ